MDITERQVIDELFTKLRQVESKAGPRDPQAEAHIRNQVGRLPAAPYYMAQTILVQEQALAAAQARIEELEHELKDRPAGGGFLTGLFGGGGTPATGRRSEPAIDPRLAAYAQRGQRGRGAGPWGGGGGGFLAGAMQTAVGVAGGMMLANALGGLLAPDEAAAAEPDPTDSSASAEDLPDDADIGGDEGDFGSFDDF